MFLSVMAAFPTLSQKAVLPDMLLCSFQGSSLDESPAVLLLNQARLLKSFIQIVLKLLVNHAAFACML